MTVKLSWAGPIDNQNPNTVIYLAAGLTPIEINKMELYLSGEEEFVGTGAYLKLYDYFNGPYPIRMPYDIAKGIGGDPDTWIINFLTDREV